MTNPPIIPGRLYDIEDADCEPLGQTYGRDVDATVIGLFEEGFDMVNLWPADEPLDAPTPQITIWAYEYDMGDNFNDEASE